MSSLVRLLNRINLHRDVFGVYSKVDILYYSQNGQIEGLHLKNAMRYYSTKRLNGSLHFVTRSVPLQNDGQQLRFEGSGTLERKRRQQ